jgi:stringent starvation protein B
MISTKPYLIRAIFEWCVDQGMTPYVSVAVDADTRVPREFVEDGQIVLNIAPDAANGLLLENDKITFQARFKGVAFSIVIPVGAVNAIFARENGQGMWFGRVDEDILDVGESTPTTEQEHPRLAATENPPQEPPPASGKRPHLTRVK